MAQVFDLKVVEDDFRRKLDPNNIRLYEKDVLMLIEFEYDEARRLAESAICEEKMPLFSEIKDEIGKIVEGWWRVHCFKCDLILP